MILFNFKLMTSLSNLNSDIIEIINNKYIKSSMNDLLITLNKKNLMLELKNVCYEIKLYENEVLYWEEEERCEFCGNMCKTRTFGNNVGIPCCVKCSIECINNPP